MSKKGKKVREELVKASNQLENVLNTKGVHDKVDKLTKASDLRSALQYLRLLGTTTKQEARY